MYIVLSIFFVRARSLVVSNLRLETKGSLRICLLAMCRGELSAAIACLLSKFL